ncbi:MAG: DUF3306 domain-containing protein [Burkholderiales bacterium]
MQESDDDKKPFLSRWSQRKLQAEKDLAEKKLPAAEAARDVAARPAGALSAEVTAADAAQANVPPAELPSIDSVNLESGVAPFFRQQADEGLRRLALKKLLSDPHFNIMDGLDIYVGDYSQPDPIPPEMMKKIRHARQWVMTPEEIIAAEKVDAEEDLALKLAREAKRAQEEKLALEQVQAQQNGQQNQLDNSAASELNVPHQSGKK